MPSIPVLDLLLQMRLARIHMALVVDEYGGIDEPFVTIKDLVETIVGDISDEHDEDLAPQITERPDGTIDLDARTPIKVFEARLGQVLTEEERAADIDTVGGLIFTLAGRVPAKGNSFPPLGARIPGPRCGPRRIRPLRVRLPGPSRDARRPNRPGVPPDAFAGSPANAADSRPLKARAGVLIQKSRGLRKQGTRA